MGHTTRVLARWHVRWAGEGHQWHAMQRGWPPGSTRPNAADYEVHCHRRHNEHGGLAQQREASQVQPCFTEFRLGVERLGPAISHNYPPKHPWWNAGVGMPILHVRNNHTVDACDSGERKIVRENVADTQRCKGTATVYCNGHPPPDAHPRLHRFKYSTTKSSCSGNERGAIPKNKKIKAQPTLRKPLPRPKPTPPTSFSLKIHSAGPPS